MQFSENLLRILYPCLASVEQVRSIISHDLNKVSKKGIFTTSVLKSLNNYIFKNIYWKLHSIYYDFITKLRNNNSIIE